VRYYPEDKKMHLQLKSLCRIERNWKKLWTHCVVEISDELHAEINAARKLTV